jgi:recombination protein RecT
VRDEKKQPTFAIVKQLFEEVNNRKRLDELLRAKAPQFISSVIQLASQPNFRDVDAGTIVASSIVSATLNLPIHPALGLAHIVPYNNKKKNPDGTVYWVREAQFQLGYKGYIQLAIRTGQYKLINACEVYEGEIKGTNRITGEITLNDNFKLSKESKVAGYGAYLRLNNGFEKFIFWETEEVTAHAIRYSKSYDKDKKDFTGIWKSDFDKMSIKTVLKELLSKYGILSVELQTAIEKDQSVSRFNEKGEVVSEYLDNPEPDQLAPAKETYEINMEVESAKIISETEVKKDTEERHILAKDPDIENKKAGDKVVFETKAPEAQDKPSTGDAKVIDGTTGVKLIIAELSKYATKKALTAYKRKISPIWKKMSATEQDEIAKAFQAREAELTT